MAKNVSHNKVRTSIKQEYYVNKIEQNSGNQKALFSITDNLLNMKTDPELPSHATLDELIESCKQTGESPTQCCQICYKQPYAYN